MKTDVIENKETKETMTTKEGEPLVKNTLELGDELIPLRNKVFVTEHEAEIKGKKKKLKRYTIVANVRNSETQKPIEVNGKHDLFIDLTEGQAKSFLNAKEEGEDITQHLWNTYVYENEFGEQLGIGIKGRFKPPKKFEDFEETNE